MIKRKQKIDLGSSIESVYTDTPELLFPSLYDKEFNISQDLRACSEKYAELNAQKKFAFMFWNKFRTVKNIIIIDGFFNEIEPDFINSNIQRDARLEIYTSCSRKEAERMLSSIKHENTFLYHLKKGIVIHDRYAILDNELFHFGSTVGGFTNHFTTYSRGWEKEKLAGLLEFFEKICKASNLIEEIKVYDR